MSDECLRHAFLLSSVFLLVPGCAHAAHATTGGPTWVVPLGYAPATQCVYWGLDSQSEAEPGSDPRIFYFDLRSAEPGAAHLVGWSHPESSDAKFRARREAFVRALRPLQEEYGPQLMRFRRVEAVDSIRTWDGFPLARYQLATFPQGDFQVSIQVLALDSSEVSVARVLRIPGRSERLIVIAFVGDPFESTYETQWPVLRRKGFVPPRVEWNPPTR